MPTSTRTTVAVGCAVALGALPLATVFEEWRWLWYAWAGIAAVVGAHLLARLKPLPLPLIPASGAAGLLVYLTVVFAADTALLGVIPTPASVETLGEGLRRGLDDVSRLAAPVPATRALVLLTAACLGGVAIAVDLIAVVLGRPAAAGLALLPLYAVPVALARDGVPWLLFAACATGYLVLLLAEGRERLLRWGLPVREGPDPEGAVPSYPPGRRIGAAAIALAVALPLLVPGLTGGALSRLGRTGVGTGTGGSGALNEFVSLRGQLQRGAPLELMRVRTDLDQPFYLRTKLLDRYQTTGFAADGHGGGQPVGARPLPEPREQPRTGQEDRYTTTVTLTSNYADDHLPVYYLPLEIDGVGAGWRYDSRTGEVFARQRRGDFDYTVSGVVPRPSAQTLAAVGPLTTEDRGRLSRTVTERPIGLPDLVRATVTEIVGDETSPYRKAKAINDYFTDGRRGFRYALSTRPGNSGSALADFLVEKQGYCEQYAAAMAVMLRFADIPSRIALGYTAGTRQQDGSYSVTTSDSHAWVEVFFSGVGWVTFDPTPLADGRTIGLPYAPRPAGTPTASPPTGTGGAVPSSGPTSNRLPGEDLEGGASSSSSGSPSTSWRTVVAGAAVLAALLLLLAPAALRLASRRRRLRRAAGPDPVGAAQAAWDELVGTAGDYGVPVPGTETPRGLAVRLGRDMPLDPGAMAGLRLVALAEERARYAPRAGVEGDLPTAIRAVRRGLRDSAGRGRRWRAALLPPSTLAAARRRSAARAAVASASVSRLRRELRRPTTPRRR